MTADDMVLVELDATDPDDLFDRLPERCFMRISTRSGPGGGWPVVQLVGPEDALKAFVDDNWDLDMLPEWGELTKEGKA